MRMLRNPKHYYLFGALINALGAFIIIAFWRNESNTHQYLSHIAASSAASYFILMISLIAQMGFTYYFVSQYFFQNIQASQFFRLNYYAVLITFLVVAVFPMTEGVSGRIHEVFSNLSLLTSTCIYIQLCLNKQIATKIRLVIVCALLTGFSLHWVFSAIAWQLTMVALGELSILLVTYKNKPLTSSLR